MTDDPAGVITGLSAGVATKSKINASGVRRLKKAILIGIRRQ